MKRDVVSLRHDEIRSFVYVNDVCDIIKKVIDTAAANRISCLPESRKRSLDDAAAGNVVCDPARIYQHVFNVGGPRGLSRLDLASIVARVDGSELIVADSEEEAISLSSAATTSAEQAADAKRPWCVTRSSNADSVKATGIRNPRDVTMDSTATEEAFGMKFKDAEEALALIVPKILHPEKQT
jgi:dTDP-4-dehydrorhamnose reductase